MPAFAKSASEISQRQLSRMKRVPRTTLTVWSRKPSGRGAWLILLLLAGGTVRAQHNQNSGALTGSVVAVANRKAIEGVTITVVRIGLGFRRTTTTASNGSYSVGYLSPGNYAIEASHPDYENLSGVFNIGVALNDTREIRVPPFEFRRKRATPPPKKIPPADLLPPLLMITSHADGETVGTSNVTLAGTATDATRTGNGVASVTVNGKMAVGGSASEDETARWRSEVTLAQGSNTIIVSASDNSPKKNATTESITIYFEKQDATGPSLTLESHQEGDTVGGARITLAGTATDDQKGGNGLRSITVNGDGVEEATASGSERVHWSHEITLTRGPNTISVMATDNSPGRNETTLSITVHYQEQDRTGPRITITSHQDGETVGEQGVVVAGRVSDAGRGNNGVSSVTVNGKAGTDVKASGDGSLTWSRQLTLAEGENTIRVEAVDGSPSQNQTSVSITIDYRVPDRSGPQITITAPSVGQTVAEDVIVISGTATDSGRGDSGVHSVTVNADPVVGGSSAAGSDVADWNHPVTLTVGANTITIVATDGSPERNSTSETVSIRRELPAVPITAQQSQQSIQLVNTSSPTRGASFDERQLSSLPLPDIRTFDSLAFLIAGISAAPQSLGGVAGPGIGAGVGSSGQFSVNGMRSRANNFTLDGSDNNDQDVGVRRQGFLSLLPQSIESIQAFQMSTLLWDAELGRNLGAQVNAVTKSGANAIHGEAYGFFTNSRLNARNFFDYTGGPAGSKESFTRVQSGISLAGPIIRNKTHFFASYEHQKINATSEQHFASPTAAERRFQNLPLFKVITSPNSLNNQIDYETSQGATPLGLNLLSLYPLPNNPGGPFGINNFTERLPASGEGNVFSFKVTHQLNSGNLLHARYNFTQDKRELPSIKRAINSTIDSDSRSQNVSLILDSQLSGSWINQARFSYGRTRLDFTEHAGSPLSLSSIFSGNVKLFLKDGREVGEATVPSFSGPLGELVIRPFSSVGIDAATFPQGRINNTFQYADTVSRTLGNHWLKFGADIRSVQFNSRQERYFRPFVEVNNGTLTIADLSNPANSSSGFVPGVQLASLGQISSILQTVTQGVPNSNVGLRSTEFNFFVNDNWRLAPNLSLDIGLRYEFNTTPGEVNNRIEEALGLLTLPAPGFSRFDTPARTEFYNQVVDAYRTVLDGRSKIYDSDSNNLGPHIGLAWDPFGNGETAVRAGYGLYYDSILGALVSQSRNVFPTEVPFLSEATFFGYDGLNANNPAFFCLLAPEAARCTPESSVAFILPGTNQLGGETNDFPALTGQLLASTTEAGGLTFTLPEKKLHTPSVHQWHLSMERGMFGNYLFSASYVGTKGTNLSRLTTPNGGPNVTPVQVLTLRQGATPTVSFDAGDQLPGNQLPISRREPFLGAYQTFENGASSTYHALQLEARKRYADGFNFTLAYTWSHAIDEVSDIIETAGAPSIAQDSSNLRAERAHSGFDVRHRLAASFLWDLPFSSSAAKGLLGGWQLAGIFRASSGLPFTLNVPFDANQDGNLTDRPSTMEGLVFVDRHARERVSVMQGRSVDDFFVVGRNGIVGRNSVGGDGLVNLDLAVSKRFWFDDARFVSFRVEFFNLFNRSNFGLPVRIIGNPGFGSSVNTVTPARIIQFALKVNF